MLGRKTGAWVIYVLWTLMELYVTVVGRLQSLLSRFIISHHLFQMEEENITKIIEVSDDQF